MGNWLSNGELNEWRDIVINNLSTLSGQLSLINGNLSGTTESTEIIKSINSLNFTLLMINNNLDLMNRNLESIDRTIERGFNQIQNVKIIKHVIDGHKLAQNCYYDWLTKSYRYKAC
jgi:hypothetical protein